MRRIAAALALATGGLVLAGCVYNPYTGAYWPCCATYGYPYGYRYPPPYYPPYGYPAAPYAMPPEGYPVATPGMPGPAASSAGAAMLALRFAAANVTHDGRLTRDQAAAGMPAVAQYFDAIDIDRKGYVTLAEVRAYFSGQRADQAPTDLR